MLLSRQPSNVKGREKSFEVTLMINRRFNIRVSFWSGSCFCERVFVDGEIPEQQQKVILQQ